MHFSTSFLYGYSLQSSPPILWRVASRCPFCLLGEFVPDLLREQVCRLVVEFFAVLEREATSARGMAGAARCGDEVEVDVRNDLGVSLLCGPYLSGSAKAEDIFTGLACVFYSRWRRCSYPVVPLLRVLWTAVSLSFWKRNKE